MGVPIGPSIIALYRTMFPNGSDSQNGNIPNLTLTEPDPFPYLDDVICATRGNVERKRVRFGFDFTDDNPISIHAGVYNFADYNSRDQTMNLDPRLRAVVEGEAYMTEDGRHGYRGEVTVVVPQDIEDDYLDDFIVALTGSDGNGMISRHFRLNVSDDPRACERNVPGYQDLVDIGCLKLGRRGDNGTNLYAVQRVESGFKVYQFPDVNDANPYVGEDFQIPPGFIPEDTFLVFVSGEGIGTTDHMQSLNDQIGYNPSECLHLFFFPPETDMNEETGTVGAYGTDSNAPAMFRSLVGMDWEADIPWDQVFPWPELTEPVDVPE